MSRAPRPSGAAARLSLLAAVALLLAGPSRSADAPVASAAGAGPCGSALDARQRRLLSGNRLQLAFAPRPAPLAVGRHFGLDIVVCPRIGYPMPIALQVDATMPAHRHGMNYRPTVRLMGDGQYRADGLLLHMPGRWQFVFDLSVDGRIERLSQEVDVP